MHQFNFYTFTNYRETQINFDRVLAEKKNTSKPRVKSLRCLMTMIATVSAAVNQVDLHCFILIDKRLSIDVDTGWH